MLGIAHGILEGNKIHETLLRRGVFKHVNLTVPEAIKGGGLATRHIIEWVRPYFIQNLITNRIDLIFRCNIIMALDAAVLSVKTMSRVKFKKKFENAARFGLSYQ